MLSVKPSQYREEVTFFFLKLKGLLVLSRTALFVFFVFILFSSTANSSDDLTSDHPFLKSISKGAAAGYLPDFVCSNCHKSHYDSYQNVGMSRSFGSTREVNLIEDFTDNHYYHEKSQRHYKMNKIGDDIVFIRYQLDNQGEPINVFEKKVNWILGSGNKARSYLFQVPSGKLYQLPIGWYTQNRQWAMSPGYDKQSHTGVRREVRRECMFCHNAFPEVVEESDSRGHPHLYPIQLPHGTGCQRCHGPGESHVRTALKKETTIEEIQSSIVNPGKLPKTKEMDVCFQCHLLPAVNLVGVRRFDVHDYSYRPGEALSDFLLNVDVDTQGEKRSDRFEINHHPYRLMQSTCFTKSGKTHKPMTCLSCHNPHLKPEGKQRFTHFRDACLQCHTKHDPVKLLSTLKRSISKPDLEYVMRQTVKGIDAKPSETFNPENCFACHMPQRRTQDVVKVTMTDHLITKEPGTGKIISPLEENTPIITNLEFFDKENAPKGDEGEIYRVIATIRQLPSNNAVDYLHKLLQRSPSNSARPYSDLVTGLIKLKRFKEAEAILKKHLIPYAYPESQVQLAVVYIASNQAVRAINLLEKSVKAEPLRAASWYNLGLAYLKMDKLPDAISVLKESIRLEPIQEKAWYYLGKAYLQQSKNKDAIASFKNSLRVDPDFSRAYLELVKTLKSTNKIKEAKRYLIHGIKVSNKPEILEVISLE